MANISKEVNIEMLEKLPDGTYKKKNPATKAELVKETPSKRFVSDLEKSEIAKVKDKSDKTYVDGELAKKIEKDKIGVTNGVASLDSNAKIPLGQIPDTARQQTYVISTELEKDNIADLISGEKAFVTGNGNSYIWDGTAWRTSAKPEWENVNLQWVNLKGVPAEFNPKDHTHAIDEVNGLSVELGKKADGDHVDRELDKKETPAGAQAKATKALEDAKTHTNIKVKTDVPSGAVFTDTTYVAGDNIAIVDEKISVIGQLGLTEEEVREVKVDRAKNSDTVGGLLPSEITPDNLTADELVLGNYKIKFNETENSLDVEVLS